MSFALVILDSATTLVNYAEFATFSLFYGRTFIRSLERLSVFVMVSQVFFLIGWAVSYHLLQSKWHLASRLGGRICGEGDKTAELQWLNLTPMCVEFGASNHSLPSTALDDMKPAVRLLTLADLCHAPESDGAGVGKPHAYTYNLLSATILYVVVSYHPRRTHGWFTLVILDSAMRPVNFAEFAIFCLWRTSHDLFQMLLLSRYDRKRPH
jgi:hypothetical protein